MAAAKRMTPEVARGYLQPYDSWANRVALLRFVQDIPLSSRDLSWQELLAVEKGLAKLQDIPMLILWGGRDFCFTRQFYEEWCRRFPASERHYFPEAGHYVLEDAFEEIAPMVAAFFQKTASP
jgi:haloalkane dehalogenase